jgi:hypothetical protein
MRCSFFGSHILIYSGVIGDDFGVLPERSARSCLTHFVIVERPTFIALSSVKDGVILVDNLLRGCAFEFRTKFLLFIGAPVLFWGEHITSVQVAKFSKPLQSLYLLHR